MYVCRAHLQLLNTMLSSMLHGEEPCAASVSHGCSPADPGTSMLAYKSHNALPAAMRRCACIRTACHHKKDLQGGSHCAGENYLLALSKSSGNRVRLAKCKPMQHLSKIECHNGHDRTNSGQAQYRPAKPETWALPVTLHMESTVKITLLDLAPALGADHSSHPRSPETSVACEPLSPCRRLQGPVNALFASCEWAGLS